MVHALLLAAVLVAAPAPAATLGFDNARHLLNRTSFAANPADIDAFAGLTREQAADRLLAWTGKPAVTPPPAWTEEPFESRNRFRGMSVEERRLANREMVQKAFALRSWRVADAGPRARDGDGGGRDRQARGRGCHEVRER